MPNKREYLGNYIAGRFTKVTDAVGEVVSRSPGNLQLASVKFPYNYTSVKEVSLSARKAFNEWKKTDTKKRFESVRNYRALLEKNQKELCWAISFETGRPLWDCQLEFKQTLELLDYYLSQKSLTSEHAKETHQALTSEVIYQPRGVVACICPAICPIQDSHAQWIPALLEGNTIVLKSSRQAPMVGQTLSEIIAQAGWPAGVVNVLHGDSEVAQRLATEPEIDVLCFTGSYETGLKIKQSAAADYNKLLILEMVGKNGIVVWDDADFDLALKDAIFSCFLSTGQRRQTTSRLMLHSKIFDKFLEKFHQMAKRCSIGFALMHESKEEPFMGPLLNEAALENYIRMQGIAVREGCEEIMRGKILEREEKGYYVSPSIHCVEKVDAKSVYQKNEMFGPNVAVYRVEALEQVAEILQPSVHGFVQSIYTKNTAVFHDFRAQTRSGVIHQNTPTIEPLYQLPQLGLKKSGNNRPMGRMAFSQVTYSTSSWIQEGKARTYPTSFPRGD